MSLILSLETSTNVCSVAIHQNGKLVASSEVHIEQSHASKLAVLINEVKTLSGIELKDLNAVAISSGPGSYTGLRIGTSTAKGVCYALSIPLLSATTLDLMAYQISKANFSNALLCPMIDARRMEVYCQVIDNKLNVKSGIEAKVIDEFSFNEFLKHESVIFFGNGADKCDGLIVNKNAVFIKNIFPSAAALGELASVKLSQNLVEDLIHFEPFYLKDFVAKKAVALI